MSTFIYSKMEGKNDPMFGKFEHPIKAIIENESNQYEADKDVLNTLFNVEKSNRYAETVIGQSDFDTFQSVQEGQGAENDSVEATYKKTIEHIAFMKEFTITREMADDSKFGMASNMSNAAKGFTRAYYRTRNKIAAQALINGTGTSFVFNKATVDTSTGDSLALFHKAHTYATRSGTQANYFVNGTSTSMTSESAIEDTLGELANKLRNFKDENGETMGYVANTIIIPQNRPSLEKAVKKICGSELSAATNSHFINTQYGNWNFVVLDGWTTSVDKMMIMSSDANEQLMGNMFYNRVPLDIRSWIDDHTRNYIWNGYCRFGLGFTTWKHILLFDDSSSNSAAETI